MFSKLRHMLQCLNELLPKPLKLLLSVTVV